MATSTVAAVTDGPTTIRRAGRGAVTSWTPLTFSCLRGEGSIKAEWGPPAMSDVSERAEADREGTALEVNCLARVADVGVVALAS